MSETIAEGINGEQHWRVTVEPDDDVESPRENDNLWTIVHTHPNYAVGDESFKGRPANLAEHVRNQGIRLSQCLVRPIYAYEHGGITISTTPFSDAFDSGQVGEAYVLKSRLRSELQPAGEVWTDEQLRAKGEEVLQSEVAVLDQYLQGEVYRFTYEVQPVERDEDGDIIEVDEDLWEHEDSCGGFYGSDWATNGMTDYLPEVAVAALTPEPAKAKRPKM